MTKGRVLAAMTAAVMFVVFSQTAAAQYPPPKGSLICQVGQSRAVVNSNIVLYVKLIDTRGFSMSGQRVDFSLTGAGRLSHATSITNANGETSVTILTGDSAGRIDVFAVSDGVACRAAIETLIPVVERPAVATPVAQVASAVSPPRTGSAGLLGGEADGGSTTYLLIGGVFVTVLLASTGGLMLVRARRTS